MQKRTIPSVKIEEKEALGRAQALCARREYCLSEMEQKLVAWGLATASQERVLDSLVDDGFINEARFARAYALDKMRYNHWGRVNINQCLRLLGLSDTDRSSALKQLPDDEYLDILNRVANQKWPQIQGRSDYERYGKLVRFLVGRGFEPDLAMRVAEQLKVE